MISGEVELPIDAIQVGERLRAANLAAVDELAVSIGETGLAHPVLVRSGPGGYVLVLGLHRLLAHRKLGRTSIRARVAALSDLDARQLEIDENLIRSDLSPLEEKLFLAERLEVYAERHPDQVVYDNAPEAKRRGRPSANIAKLSKFPGGHVKAIMGFAEETAQRSRLSRRSVYRAVQALAGLQPILPLIRGTWIADNDAVQRQLSRVSDPALQAAAVEALLSGATKSVSEAVAIASGSPPSKAVPSPVDEVLKAFRAVWGKASPSARASIVVDLAARKLPGEWALIPSDAPEFAAWRARVAPPAGPGPDDYLEGFDDE